MALYQKYRSKTFSELVGQDHVNLTMLEAIKSGKTAHAYLLTGPRGTGKTSTARLLSRAMNCFSLSEAKKAGKEISGEPCNKCDMCKEILDSRATDVIEIDAASHTGVDDIREIIDKARFAPTRGAKKVYIIDEVHMLSKSAFNALLKTLEEPPSHVVFILATTEAHKLPETILSRVQRYDFRRVSKSDIIKNLKIIAEKEKLTLEDGALDLLAIKAEGSHRDSISLLEHVASYSQKISKSDVENILGMAKSEEVLRFIGAIFNRDPEEGLKIAQQFYSDGIEMGQFNKEVIEYIRKILIYKVSEQALFEETEENIKNIKELSAKCPEADVLNAMKSFLRAGEMLKDVAYPILPIEMAVIELCGQDSITVSSPKSKVESKDVKDSIKDAIAVISSPEDVAVSVISTSFKTGMEKSQLGSSPLSSAPDDKAKDDSVLKVSKSGDKKREPENDKGKEMIAKASTQTPVFQMTGDLWEQLIVAIKAQNTTLSALLRDVKPLSINGNQITIGARFKFHKDRISEPKNSKIIEEAICSLTGNNCVVMCEVMDAKMKQEVPAADLGKAAEEVFG